MKNVNFDEESIVILEKQNVDLSDVKVKCKDNGKNLYIEYSIYADLRTQNI